VAQTFGRDEIRRMGEYWYEENWYSTRVTLASGTSSIFPQATGWNPNPSPSLMVTLEDVATPQDPYLELVATADRFSRILYAAQHRPRLEPVALHMRAVSSLSLVATPNGGAITDDPVVYRVSVLKLPITWKVMLGYPITALESEIAKEVGISTSPVAQDGHEPDPHFQRDRADVLQPPDADANRVRWAGRQPDPPKPGHPAHRPGRKRERTARGAQRGH